MSEAAKKQGLDAITNEVDEYEVKKKYIMTEARAENLRKAREKATKLRQELKDLKKPNAAPPRKPLNGPLFLTFPYLKPMVRKTEIIL